MQILLSWIGFMIGLALAVIGMPLIFIGACLEIGRTIVQSAGSKIDKERQYQSM